MSKLRRRCPNRQLSVFSVTCNYVVMVVMSLGNVSWALFGGILFGYFQGFKNR